jgi:hypothetical protein
MYRGGVQRLLNLRTKPIARFTGVFPPDELREVADFLMAVAAADKAKSTAQTSDTTVNVESSTTAPEVEDDLPSFLDRRPKSDATLQAEAPPTVGEQHDSTLVWSTLSNGIVTTTGSIDFKITAASRDGAVTHYALMVKAKGADWSSASVLDRFKTLEAAKEFALGHALGDKAKAEAETA